MLFKKLLDAKKNHYKRLIQWGLLLIFFGAIPLNSANLPTIREYQIKAVYLYNFANFIKWPRATFESSSAPFQICVLGDDPFRTQLDLVVENEKIKGRVVKIQRIHYVEESDSCQIVFVSQSKQRYQAHIFAYLQQRPVLTVSDIENFATKGGMVQFYHRGNKIRFIIAPQAVRGAGLQASSRLLQIAKIVR